MRLVHTPDMNILLVCKHIPEFQSGLAPFTETMVTSIRKQGIKVDIYPIKRKGILGYLYHIFELNFNLLFRKNKIDIIHAINGLSGIVASFQPFKKYLVTFIGSDIYNTNERKLLKLIIISKIRISIFVNSEMLYLAGNPSNNEVVPFGIDLTKFHPLEKSLCRKILNMNTDTFYVLFGSKFDKPVKNSKLIHDAIKIINRRDIVLLELNGISEDILNTLYNAIDVLVLTSFQEGSPTVIKEAMACNCPIIATKVGDIEWLFGNEPGHYLASFDARDVAEKILKVKELNLSNFRTRGRSRITKLGLDSENIAKRIIHVYSLIISETYMQKP